MDTLPSEILYDILTRLYSQRDFSNCLRVCKRWQSVLSVPTIYSTVELASSSQVIKFFHFAKTVTIDGVPIGHFVYCLKLHTRDLSKEIIAKIPYTLPNIQHVIELTEDRRYRERLQQKLQITNLTHLYYWNAPLEPKSMQLINVNKVTFLQFYVHENYLYLTNQHASHQQFGLRQDMDRKCSVLRDDEETADSGLAVEAGEMFYHYSKILELPYLMHLTTLGIEFVELDQWDTINYDLDERTLESIHQSCPLIKSLQFKSLKMNISDSFETLLTSSSGIKPITSLKALEIYGCIYDARCYYYLSVKYPQLEQLKLSLKWSNPSQNESLPQDHQNGLYEPFYLSLHNMMASYQRLKQLSLVFLSKFGKFSCNDFTPTLSTFLTSRSWTHPKIISWLLSSPTNYSPAITHLKCPLNMVLEKDHKIKKIIDHRFYSENNSNNYDGIDNNMKDPSLLYFNLHQYLTNGLTSLTFTIDFDIKKLADFLSQGGKKTPVCLTLNELKMKYTRHDVDIYLGALDNYQSITINDDFYIYEWLAMFPKLKIFNFKSGVLIKDGIRPKDNRNNGLNSDAQQQQQQQQQEQQENDSLIAQSYPLEELILRGGGIYFKNGFTAFSRKCPHLKRIDLRNTYYALPHWKEQDLLQVTHINQKDEKSELYKDMIFDLSHLRLDYVSFYKMRFMPWLTIEYNKQPAITTLILKEMMYDNKDIMVYSDCHRAPGSYPTKFPMNVDSFPDYLDFPCRENNQYFVEMQPFNQFSLRIICQSVETLVFKV
ncbi:hypothetical protein BJ944DRAFT_267320 [Cunninghamella echinulata]|nr:hypothetical protein BJ944DRAFT_267320 [Cunninghamella echinulata]